MGLVDEEMRALKEKIKAGEGEVVTTMETAPKSSRELFFEKLRQGKHKEVTTAETAQPATVSKEEVSTKANVIVQSLVQPTTKRINIIK